MPAISYFGLYVKKIQLERSNEFLLGKIYRDKSFGKLNKIIANTYLKCFCMYFWYLILNRLVLLKMIKCLFKKINVDDLRKWWMINVGLIDKVATMKEVVLYCIIDVLKINK